MSLKSKYDKFEFEGFADPHVSEDNSCLPLYSSRELNVSCCDYCNFLTYDEEELATHLRKHMGVKPYICTHCNVACIYEESLKSHMLNRHNI